MKKIEPVAHARKWCIDKEEPYKIRREKDNRLVWHAKFRFMPVTNGRIFPDDCALYTSEALEAVAKAVQQAAFGVAWDDNDRHEIKQIDTASIINQLTGE